MNGPNYRHLDKRKRQIYKQYLDYSNKKVGTDRNVLRLKKNKMNASFQFSLYQVLTII